MCTVLKIDQSSCIVDLEYCSLDGEIPIVWKMPQIKANIDTVNSKKHKYVVDYVLWKKSTYGAQSIEEELSTLILLTSKENKKFKQKVKERCWIVIHSYKKGRISLGAFLFLRWLL